MSVDTRTGVVVGFDEHVGLGTVRDDAGEELFFHCTQIADGSRMVAIGVAVRFVVVPAHKGVYQAVEIRPA